MADFVDSEAEVSDGSDSEEENLSRRKRVAISSDEDEDADKEQEGDEEMKNFIADSSAEEDEDGMDNDLEDLIDDRPVEDQEGDDSGNEREKRKHDESDLEEDLSDDDYALIEENLGIKVKRKQKRKRIRVVSDDESEAGSDREAQPDDREAIQRELFDGGDEDDEDAAPHEAQEEQQKDTNQEFADLDGSEESDPDDFIVDEDNQPISKGKKKKHIIHDDAALQEAQDIFGVDFDFDEFEQYGEDYDEEEELEEEYEDEEEEIGEDGEPKPRRKKAAKRRAAKTTIYDYFEPSELERGHFTDLDNEIRTSDMPERFQLRGIPVCPLEEGELDEECDWIFKYAFNTPPVSTQELSDGGDNHGTFRHGLINRRSPTTINRIAKALEFMRNNQFEVPFIAFYRKEYVEPELNINDLWKVYQWDEKWMQLRNRRQNLVRLFEKMQQYQIETIDQERTLDSNFRTLTEEDINRAKCVQTLEELKDVYQHFLLYYSSEMPRMKAHFKNKKKEKKPPAEGEEGDEGENQEPEEEEEQIDTLKQATRKTGYTMCERAGLGDLARRFGLTPEQFGENLRDNYQRHEVEQEPAEPEELANEFIKGTFQSSEDVLKGARHMVAMQIAHDPLVRQTIRQTFYERAKITIRPTRKGMKEIDESHPCTSVKYVKNKPVRDLENDQFLKLKLAEDDGLLTFTIHIDDYEYTEGTKVSSGLGMYQDEIRQLYHRDEFSTLVQEWNNQRSQALERALNQILYPQLVKELYGKLLDESKEHIIKSSCQKLYNYLKVAPYQADQQLDDDDDDFDTSKGIRVMGVAYLPERDQAAFCAVIDGDGDVMDHLRLPALLKRRNAWREEDREAKEADMNKLKEFISNKKPHVIAVAGQSRDAISVIEDMKRVVSELEQEEQMAPIGVELVDNELSIVYSNCKKSEQDFRDYPPLLRQAVSLARRLQDPLIEFCQLCNADEDLLCLKFHPLQDQVDKEELLNALYLEFVNRVNEVGVDVNQAVVHSSTAGLVQFVCGLGPRKGSHLLRILKQNNTRLENRTQLVMMCHMGPKVFINCAGFIKIDTNSLGDSTDAYVEVLDGSRVHPETYEWARKMAVDALEYDDTAEDANPAGALEEILESPERLRDLDLDAFAEELERQGYGNKHITLYDIRAELNHRYKDLRTPYRAPTPEEKFNMLTKESPRTFYVGKLIQCIVTGIAHRRPQGDQLDQANPVRDDDTGLWACPFCQKKDFPELSEVWNHFDAGECPGQAVGVKLRLDNGVSGFLHVKNLSDKKVTNPEERVRVGMQMHCRITKIDIDKFQVELTSRTSDLVDADHKWKLQKDPYYDQEAEDIDVKKEEDKKKQQSRQTYVKRVIAHPSFHNVDFRTSQKLMEGMEQGDVIIRPSSKGSDHLTLTWKVMDGIHQHIDIREEGKENAFSLGSSLWIENEEFEDLDEIIARHVQPMAAFARDIMNYKYYQNFESGAGREQIDKILIDEKKKAPSRIPYFFSASKSHPGKFMLSYLPRKSTKHEYVSVTPDGFRYRQQMFHSIGSLIRWFKEHFRDPIPGTPSGMRTPMAGATNNAAATPSVNLSNIDSATIRRAAAGLSSGMFNTLAQVAGQTPGSQFNQPGFGGGNFNAGAFGNFGPGVTPMMTPMMTPSYAGGQNLTTPGQHMTPGHIATTPAPHGINTPAHQGMSTPQYQPTTTPRSSNWPGATPSRTPAGGRTPSRTPSHHQVATAAAAVAARNRGHAPQQNSASVDWAKAAAMWAQRGNDRSKKGESTPRHEESPDASPAGDATPLFDER